MVRLHNAEKVIQNEFNRIAQLHNIGDRFDNNSSANSVNMTNSVESGDSLLNMMGVGGNFGDNNGSLKIEEFGSSYFSNSVDETFSPGSGEKSNHVSEKVKKNKAKEKVYFNQKRYT